MQSSAQGWRLQILSGNLFQCLTSHIRQIFLYIFIWNFPCFDMRPFPSRFLLCTSEKNLPHFLHCRLPKTAIKSPLALFSPHKANPAFPASQVVCSSPQTILVTYRRPPASFAISLALGEGSWRGTQSWTHRSRCSLTAAE